MEIRSEPVVTPGLRTVEHELSVPLDHADPAGEHLTVFAREIADPDGLDRPFLLFLQGGPGFEGPRPARLPTSPGWLDRALRDFRVLSLDQRGTGRSTPVGARPASARPSRPSACATSAPTPSSATPSCCARRSASSAGACSGRASAASAS